MSAGLRVGSTTPWRAAPAPELAAPWLAERPRSHLVLRASGEVDNLDWVDLPGLRHPLDGVELERRYLTWVPRLTAGGVQASALEGGRLTQSVRPLGWPRLIRLGPATGDASVQTRAVEGGLLAAAGGSLSIEQHFRPEGCRLVVAVRGLRPRLPRWLYVPLQARLHRRVTAGFLRSVARLSANCEVGYT